MEITATQARKISESNLEVLFKVIEKAAKEGYNGIRLSNSENKQYEVEARILHTLVCDNKKYLEHLGYNVQSRLFGTVTEINWRQK